MDLVGNRRRRQQKSAAEDTLKDTYQHDLQFYNLPPTNEINLQEFEDMALERLQLLRILEQASQKGFKPYGNEWKDSVHNDMIKQGLKRYVWLAKSSGTTAPTDTDLQARRTDHISHFILRLAYCRSDDLRKWFIAREIEWFRLRFSNLSPEGIVKFLQLHDLTYAPISSDEKHRLQHELYQSTAGVFMIDAVDFYKVPYAEVITLLNNRRVYLEKGFAYIPSNELVTCVSGIFRTQLFSALSYACRCLPLMDDERISILLSNLHKLYVGKSYAQRNAGSGNCCVRLEDLDPYSRLHFPLCMRHVHETFRSSHHMKYSCRLQYGLFTKAIGLSFEDAIAFWKDEFTQKMDAQKFEKQYMYAIKHMYGKVGSMTNYSAFSCMKIINEGVGLGEHHGCPFRHWDAAALKLKLTEYGLGSGEVNEIIETASKGHYQMACAKYFEHTHGQPNNNPITHPNQYFEDSFALSNKDGKNTSEGNKTQASRKPKPVSEETSSMDVDETN